MPSPTNGPRMPRAARHPLSLALQLALVVAPVAAFAQDDAARELDAVQVTAGIARDSDSATKTDTPIAEIPQSISVITSEQLEQRGISGVEEAVWYSAGAQGGGYGPDSRSDWLLVRGFTPARYLDGLALADGSGTGITRVEPYSLERIEVLKGPASVNYGAMPPGGMLNYVSKRPREDMRQEIQLEGGNFGLAQAAADVGGALGDSVLYRLTALARNSDDPVDFIHDDRYYFAPAITWTPDEANSFTVLARWQKADTMAGAGFLPASGTLLPNPNGQIPANRFTGEPGYNDYVRTMQSIGYEFSHDFGGGTSFQQSVRYGSTVIDPSPTIGAFGLGEDGRTLTRYYFPTQEDSKNFAVDNRLVFGFTTGAAEHMFLAGLDYRRARNDYSSAFAFGAPPLDIFDPVYGAPIDIPDYTSRTLQSQSQVGLYLQDQISVGSWVTTIGLRSDSVGTDTTQVLAGTPESRQSDAETSGRIGVNYVFDNGFTPYIGYSQSFQPTVGTDFDGNAFVPTTGDQLEVGIKYAPIDGRALITLAAYELVQENTLSVDPNHTLFQVQQGETEVRGVELEGRMNIGDGLSVYGALAYIDSEVTKTTDAAALGMQIALQPKESASIGADYTFTEGALSGFGIGAGVRYIGDHYGDIYNLWETPSYTLFDASIRYDIEQWRFQLNALNVGDKEYVTVCNSAAWCYYGYPRMVRASASFSW